MADLTKSMDGIKASEQSEVRDKVATGVQKSLDYGPDGVTRVEGQGIQYPEETERQFPKFEKLRGQLDYSGSELIRAHERVADKPAPSATELSDRFETLAKKDNFVEHRQLSINTLARLNGTADDVQRITECYVDLKGNDYHSQDVLSQLKDLLVGQVKDEAKEV